MGRSPICTLLVAATLSLHAAASGAASTGPTDVIGAGSLLTDSDYAAEFGEWNVTIGDGFSPQVQLGYLGSSSEAGEQAFATDSAPLLPTVPFAVSEAPLAAHGHVFPQGSNGFTFPVPHVVTYSLLAPQDGALIQLPMLGLGVAIAAGSGNPAVRGTGALHLTDADLCGIFSGAIQSWGGIADPLPGLAGQIDVYIPGDSNSASFLFTNHLKRACSTGFTKAQRTVMPTSLFASLFGGGNPALPANVRLVTGTQGMAGALAGTLRSLGGGHWVVADPGDPQGIGFIGTDQTAISAVGRSNATLATAPLSGFLNTRALHPAAIEGVGMTVFVTPTIHEIEEGLAHPGAFARHTKPPMGAAKADPIDWVPSIPLVTKGYPVVGYSTMILAQCYANPYVAYELVPFLYNHFRGDYYFIGSEPDGFTLPGRAWSRAIIRDFLTDTSPLAIAGAGSLGTCATVTGR